MTESEKQPAALKRRKLSFKQHQQPNIVAGQHGEDSAQKFLTSKGYRILYTNIVFPVGEIDIIAFDPKHNELVFCEVKTRSKVANGLPYAAYNWRKVRSLQKAALRYLALNPTRANFRFDLITITPTTLRHFQNITIK